MIKLFFLVLCIPFFAFTQSINNVDAKGHKQGIWIKTHNNGSIRYKGQFRDNIPYGVFKYYYSTGEIQAEKEFFHKGEAAATHIFYKKGQLKASGLYVNELKDSIWNYLSKDSVLMMSEQYQKGKLNGVTKTYYYSGDLYEIKNWSEGIEDGVWVQYFIDGKIQMESMYNNGIREGKQIYYYPNGEVYCKGLYIDDKKSGVWEYFKEEGVRDTLIDYNE